VVPASVVDARAGIGNGRVLPAGPLRAPLPAQLRAADALVLIGEGEAAGPVVRAAARFGLPVLMARLETSTGADTRDLAGRRCLAFAGIGHPAKFFDTLERVGALIETAIAFPDHHSFAQAECERILRLTESRGLLAVTTGKDLARLRGRGGAAARLAETARALPVEVVFVEPRYLMHLIEAMAATCGRKLRSEAR